MNPRDDHEPAPPGGPEAGVESPVQEGRAAEANAAAVEPLTRQLKEAEDRVLRAQAELENFRKRSRREYEDEIGRAHV